MLLTRTNFFICHLPYRHLSYYYPLYHLNHHGSHYSSYGLPSGQCKRTITDTNCCLWSSWICKTSNHTYFFGGDTGYCGDIFKQTGELYPVDFAAIPIGAYGTATERWFHKPNHQNPEEAVQCHQDIKSRQSIGVHWGTFMLTGEPLLEPPQKLAAAVAAAGLKKDAFVCLGHGETIIYDLVRNGPRDVEVLKTEEEITL